LIVAGRVEGELAERPAVFGEDADLEVVDKHKYVQAGMVAADADVVEPAVVAERDHAVGVDGVVADPEVRVEDRGRERAGFGPIVERFGRGASAQRPVRTLVVVVADEGVELGLESPFGAGGWSSSEPVLQGLVEPFDFAAGLRVVRP
jgi:hypothetical protein